jgi:microcompartment protein CcmL/EutN
MIVFAGDVAEVGESIKAGIAAGNDAVINKLFLPHIHTDIIPAITATTEIEKFGAIGVVETFSIASCIVAADQAAKTASVKLVEIRLANGLGGKGYFIITGVLADIEAAVDAAKEYIKTEGLLAGCEIIPAPHEDLINEIYW